MNWDSDIDIKLQHASIATIFMNKTLQKKLEKVQKVPLEKQFLGSPTQVYDKSINKSTWNLV